MRALSLALLVLSLAALATGQTRKVTFSSALQPQLGFLAFTADEELGRIVALGNTGDGEVSQPAVAILRPDGSVERAFTVGGGATVLPTVGGLQILSSEGAGNFAFGQLDYDGALRFGSRWAVTAFNEETDALLPASLFANEGALLVRAVAGTITVTRYEANGLARWSRTVQPPAGSAIPADSDGGAFRNPITGQVDVAWKDGAKEYVLTLDDATGAPVGDVREVTRPANVEELEFLYDDGTNQLAIFNESAAGTPTGNAWVVKFSGNTVVSSHRLSGIIVSDVATDSFDSKALLTGSIARGSNRDAFFGLWDPATNGFTLFRQITIPGETKISLDGLTFGGGDRLYATFNAAGVEIFPGFNLPGNTYVGFTSTDTPFATVPLRTTAGIEGDAFLTGGITAGTGFDPYVVASLDDSNGLALVLADADLSEDDECPFWFGADGLATEGAPTVTAQTSLTVRSLAPNTAANPAPPAVTVSDLLVTIGTLEVTATDLCGGGEPPVGGGPLPVRPSLAGGTLGLSFVSQPGFIYTLQSRVSLISGDWEDETTVFIVGDGTKKVVNLPFVPGVSTKYYRLVITSGDVL